MAKLHSRKLYDLIQSMTRAEKKTFTQLARANSKAKEPKYLLLFKAIDQQEEFDGDKLEKRMLKFVKTITGFTQMKAELYQRVLDCLRYHSANKKASVDVRLKLMMLDIRELYKRGLYGQAMDVLIKMKELAYQYERYYQIPEIFKWQKQLIIKTERFIEAMLEKTYVDEKKVMEKMERIAAYWNVNYQLVALNRVEGFITQEKKLAKLDALIKTSILKDPVDKTSNESQILYHFSYALYYNLIGDFGEFYIHNKELINIMEENPHIIEDKAGYYINAIKNLVLSYIDRKDYKNAFLYLEKMVKVKTINPQYKQKVSLKYNVLKMILFTTIGSFQKAIDLAEKEIPELLTEEDKLAEFELKTLCAYAYFGIGNYSKTIDYLNEALSSKYLGTRKDLQAFVRIFLLLTHYELNNKIYLEDAVRSTHRFLNKQERLSKFERIVLKFIKKIPTIYTRRDLHNIFKGVKSDLMTLPNDPSENLFLKYFDFIAWLDSKIERKDFLTVIKSKALHPVSQPL